MPQLVFRNRKLAVSALALALVSCGSAGEEPLGVAAQRVTVPRSDVLGFEALNAWRSSTAVFALSPAHTQGKSSLEVKSSGWNDLFSAPLSSLGVGPVRRISFDIRPPSPPQNPYWFGETQLYVEIPSQGVWNLYLGRFDLALAPPGQFATATFQVPADVALKLAANYTDLTFHVAVNTPTGSTSYLLDNLRFNAKPSAVTPLAECPAFMRVLANGDVRLELVAAKPRSLVELVVRRNGTSTTQTITSSQVELQNGTFVYSATLPSASNKAGDTLAVRFRSQASGSTTDLFSPGPDAAQFSEVLNYQPGVSCLPIDDDDGDGRRNSLDECPNDPDKTAFGFCGCGKADTNGDGDSVPDCKDECPSDPDKVTAGDCGCLNAYAPAGTVCTDGPCTGKNTCDGKGKCGNALACPIPGGVGLPKEVRYNDSIILAVPNTIANWADDAKLAPAGYSRIQPDDARENAVLAAQIKKYFGSSACVWTSGIVTAPGVISSVPRSGATATPIWNERLKPPNVGNGYLPFAPGQPPPGVSSGCVTLRADGLLRVENCDQSCSIIYERSALSLIAKANPADFTVTCQDFPGVNCVPRDGFDFADEVCTPESVLPALGSPEATAAQAQIAACTTCQNQVPAADCSSVCQGMAAAPTASEGRSCAGEPATALCGVSMDPKTAKVCKTNTDCTAAGQVCGVYNYVGSATAEAEPVDFWRSAAACTSGDTRPVGVRCKTVQVCGAPGTGCETDLPGGPTCTSGPCACNEPKICSGLIPNPIGDPVPTGSLQSETFKPETKFTTIAEPPPSVIRDEPKPAPNTPPENHPWCKFAAAALEQTAGDKRHGDGGGADSFVQLAFDPNLDLHYGVKPLAQGDMDFNLSASASFAASAAFSLKGIKAKFDIIDAQIGAVASRCRLETQAKLDVFGIDFVPLIPELKQFAPKTIPADPGRCEAAMRGFEEVANRAKKAMRDAQELLNQYHSALVSKEGNTCLNPTSICQQLMSKAPPGFPKIDCSLTANISIEDIINSFIWYYERQLNTKLPLPDLLKRPDLHFDLKNPTLDLRLPNPEFPKLPKLPSVPEDILSGLPDLQGAQQELAKITPEMGTLLSGLGCAGDKVKTERQSLIVVNFALGPIPMLLEVEGVLKYGVNYGVGFSFDPKNLITSSSTKADVAKVSAVAEPCASAGVALFVGAGFSAGGFRAAAGVEGEVNLVTLSMPANASASIQAAREPVTVIDPLAELADGKGPKVARYVANELRGLWDGLAIPMYRQVVYLGYDYGARVEASQVLKGKLSATLAIKFWFFKKKWRTTLVNFGNDDHGFSQSLIHGSGELDVASGTFPWASLDLPDAFVKFRQLTHTPSEFNGLHFRDLRFKLRESSGSSDFSMPEITLPQLSRLGLDLPALSALSIPRVDLDAIRAQLNLNLGLSLTLKELEDRLTGAGIDLNAIHFSDFAKIGFKMIDFAGWSVSDDQLAALDINLSDMVKLGFDLSKLSLAKLGLPSRSFGCLPAVDLSTVGQFFFDNFCPKEEPLQTLNSIISVPDASRAVPGTGQTEEREVSYVFAGRIDPALLHAYIVAGGFDDKGDALSPTGATSMPVSKVSPCDRTAGQATIGLDLKPVLAVTYDSATNRSTVKFRLRATDVCGTSVGWAGFKLRYSTDPQT